MDDEPFVCEAVKLMLAFDGHRVETARSGKDALAILAKSNFDLVITDFSMPEMKGDELAATIKARFPGQPVVMITAYAEHAPFLGQSAGRRGLYAQQTLPPGKSAPGHRQGLSRLTVPYPSCPQY